MIWKQRLFHCRPILCTSKAFFRTFFVINKFWSLVVCGISVCGCCMQDAKSTQYFYDAQVIERGSTLPDRGKRKSHGGGPPTKKPC